MSIFTKFSLKNALIIFLIVVFLIGYGIYSTTTIQQELMPNISIPFVSVVTVYPGAAPDDVAEAISRPIGKAVSGIQGIKQINTTSNENYSLVMVNFSYSKDMEKAEQEVQDAINKVKLPDKAQKPNVTKFSYGSIPVVSYTVTSQKDENELSKIIKDKVQPELSGIKGVGQVNVSGIKEKNVFIRVDDAKLKENGISLQDIQQTLAANDISFPVGTVDITGQTIPLKITRKVSSLNDLKSIPIIIQPNSTKLLGEMIGKTASGMKDGMSSAISAMQEGMTNAISGMQEGFGKAIAGNTQAIGCLYAIQSSQAMILNQREKVLGNPASKPEDIIKAKMIIEQATKTIAQNQATLNTIMKNAMAASKAQNAMPKQASGGRKIPIAPAPNNNASDGLSLNSSNSYQIKTVFLGDIAEIKYDTLDEGVYTRANLKPTVILTIYKNETDNAVEIEKSVREKIKEITLANPDIDMIKIDDSARYITSSINGMVREGLLGALFAILIIALFLRNIRATIIAFISIPLSILIALILMPMLGVSLNMMSLSGMAVATGRIVDDSIVVIENIFRRLQLRKADEKNILLDSTREVSSAITSSTLTTIGVFLPLSFVEGMIGKVFASFALTVVICISASLLVAVTVVPLMGRFMLLKSPPKHKETEGRMNRAYKKVLSIALDNRIKVVIVSIIIMALSFLLVSRIGLKFLPPDKTNIITANLKLPPGSSAEETNKETAKMEKFLSEDSDVELITSKIGSSSEEAAFGMMQGSNEAKVTIDLKKTSDLDKALIKIRNKANELSAGNSSWFVKPQDHYSGGEKLEIVVNGNNVDDIKSASELISSKIKDMPDLSNITNNLSDKKPEISVKVDSEKAAVKGLNPYLAAMQVRSLLNYDKVTSINLEGKTIDVQLGMDKKDIDSIDKVRNLQIKGGTGAQVTISDIGEVTLQDGPVSISERDGKRYASITADIFSEDTKKTSQDIVNRVEAIKSQLKPGVTYSIGGSMDDISDSFKQMGIAMLIAILLVFSIMVLAFKEATAPLAILFSLPFAAVGAMLALVITNHPLSMSGLVGILMLIGIVVTNAIVLVDRVQTNRRKGMSIRDALIEAGGVRLRPIIMTAAATIMAIFPLAAGFSEGAIISEELGIVVIGGLTLSTVLTLVIVPVVYSLLEGLKLMFSQSKESQFDIETDAQARFD